MNIECLQFLKNYFIILLYGYFAHMYICAPRVCLLSSEAGRGCWIPLELAGTASCEPPLCALEQQPVLSPLEPSLHPRGLLQVDTIHVKSPVNSTFTSKELRVSIQTSEIRQLSLNILDVLCSKIKQESKTKE